MAAATSSEEEAKISIKVMVWKDCNRVLCAEADYKFVDILFSFMTLPLGTIVRILEGCPDTNDVPLEGLKNLYQTLKDLPANYLSSDESKYMLLNSRSSAYDLCRKLKLNIDGTEPLIYYICRNEFCAKDAGVYSHCEFSKSGKCGYVMDREVEYDNPTVSSRGNQVNGGVFVSEVTTFIVTDDLRVMPNTSDFCVQMLYDHGIINVAVQLEERSFDVGREQILIILKGILLSSFSLTYLVFPRTHYQWHLVKSNVWPLIKNEVTNAKRMKLKVTLEKSTSKFLFAEAEDDFVDFLFGFLGIPLGVVVGKLLNSTTSLVSLDSLFESISSICEGKYARSRDINHMLCEPKSLQMFLTRNHIFPLSVSNDSFLYLHHYRTYNPRCSTIRVLYLDRSSSPVGGRSEEFVKCLSLKDPRVEGSFLKAPAKFMLTDDLCVTPLSVFSTFAVLNKLEIPLYDVESYELSIGVEEGLELLKASLMPSAKCLSPLINTLLRDTADSRLRSIYFLTPYDFT